ncbi:MAG: hypothetical protein WHU10_00065 [Fimbriimonadales bacterium]
MTKAEFRSMVTTIARSFGRGITSEQGAVDAVLNERLRKFTQTTRCLYAMDVVLSLTPSVAAYPLTGDAFSRPMADVDILWVDSARLPKTEPVEEIAGYAATDPGPVASWTVLPDHTLLLLPAPDLAYPAKVAGPCAHRALTVGPDGDDETLEIPEAYLRTAAAYCAVALAFPHAVGKEDVELLQLVDRSAANEMERLKTETSRFKRGPLVRGWRKRGWHVDLG